MYFFFKDKKSFESDHRTQKKCTSFSGTRRNYVSDTSRRKIVLLFQGQEKLRKRYIARRKVLSFSRTRKTTSVIHRTQKSVFLFRGELRQPLSD
ncbi:hypothetical protein [Virgibacillus proomii]|uniref:hypothetical protein n=1 Tax=Virgibacillus proomii TaxID=84407 RepID=UPI001C128C76|nr:hypothetical protein [Virgibacillus proomii]MBU5265879.1 hypothetical protein [Virgibacillus proomii]